MAQVSPTAARMVAIAIVMYEFSMLTWRAGLKPFWNDEIITYFMSDLHKFSDLARALYAGADSMPFGFNIIVRLARVVPVDLHVALRLPSIVGYLLTLGAVFLILQKNIHRLPDWAASFSSH